MANKALSIRLRSVEERIASPECAELDEFMEGISNAIGKSVDSRLANDGGMYVRVRERMSELIWPDQEKKQRRSNYTRRYPLGRSKSSMSDYKIQFGLSYAHMSREELILNTIDPLLSALRQALNELIEDGELSKLVEEEAKVGLYEALDKIRPENNC